MKTRTFFLVLFLFLTQSLVLIPESSSVETSHFVYTVQGWRAPDKDPASILDYTIDWANWLGTDMITNSSWSTATGLSAVATTSDDTTATIWLSGGTALTTYIVTNTIITSGGRTARISFQLRVRNL